MIMDRQGFSFPLEKIITRQEARKPNAQDLPDCIEYIQSNETLIKNQAGNIDRLKQDVIELKAKLYDCQNRDRNGR